jgi:hypothetical protein
MCTFDFLSDIFCVSSITYEYTASSELRVRGVVKFIFPFCLETS